MNPATGLLDTFPIVKPKDEEGWGGYLAKRMILEIYDKMVEAIRTGFPYKTRLTTPPGPWPMKKATFSSYLHGPPASPNRPTGHPIFIHRKDVHHEC